MPEPVSDLSVVRRRGGRVEVELTLLIDAHVDEVWNALISPERLPEWLAVGHVDARLGGEVKLDFGVSGAAIDSRVTAIQPCTLIEFSWSGPGQPEQPLRWTIEPIGPTTCLTLALSLPEQSDVARSCAGWAAHLDMLVAALAHVPVKFPVDLFEDARRIFARKLSTVAQASAASPSETSGQSLR